MAEHDAYSWLLKPPTADSALWLSKNLDSCSMWLSMVFLSCRDRMSEVLSYLERNMQDLDALAADLAEAAEEAADAQAG